VSSFGSLSGRGDRSSVAPLRSHRFAQAAARNSGFRLYRMEDLERLEQIAALKFLGIPLQEIKLLLKHGPLTLADSLACNVKLWPKSEG
jgi:hypothetical protein